MSYKTISLHTVDSVKVVEVLEKRIYLDVTEVFKEEISSIIQPGDKHLIVDLSKVSVMNSAGLGVLILARDKLKRQGGTIKLVGLQPLMKDIFARMKLDILFETFDTLEDALKTVDTP